MAPSTREKDHPFWMTHEVMEKARRDMLFVPTSTRRRATHLRDKNKTLQSEQILWKLLIDIKGVEQMLHQQQEDSKEDIVDSQMVQKEVDKLEKKQAQLEEEFLSLCNSRYDGGEKYAYLPGTCGELPVHSCLLLGITDLARKLVDQMHSPEPGKLDTNTKHDVNMPYVNDFDAWRKLGLLSSFHPYDDGGLFTGETLLHIAVVQKDIPLVKWLIEDKNALVSAQATGAFFKSSELTFAKRESVGSVFGRRVAVERSRARRRQFHNPDAACDYGEFAMSFAASMGQVKMMEIMVVLNT